MAKELEGIAKEKDKGENNASFINSEGLDTSSDRPETVGAVQKDDSDLSDHDTLESIRNSLSVDINSDDRDRVSIETRKKPQGKSKLVSFFERLVHIGFNIEVSGQENLGKISDDEGAVIASSHITDNDMVILMGALGESVDENPRFGQTKLIQMADNFDNPVFKRVIKATGRENWLSVSVHGDANNRVDKYDPEDFDKINDALADGYPVAMAESLDPRSDGWRLSSKLGHGGARLALGGNTIIPVAVEISIPMPMEKTSFKQALALLKLIRRPKTRVHIGEPIRLEADDSIEIIEEVIEKRSKGESVTPDEIRQFSLAKDKLNQVSRIIKHSIANLLPPERRGD